MSDRHVVRVSAIVAIALLGYGSRAAAQIPQTFTNLQVLPKDKLK
jgi:hypothetical protein